MKQKISPNAIRIVTELNAGLFAYQQELTESVAHTNACRHYLEAEQTVDNVLELHLAMKRQETIEEKVTELDRQLKDALKNIYEL